MLLNTMTAALQFNWKVNRMSKLRIQRFVEKEIQSIQFGGKRQTPLPIKKARRAKRQIAKTNS